MSTLKTISSHMVLFVHPIPNKTIPIFDPDQNGGEIKTQQR